MSADTFTFLIYSGTILGMMLSLPLIFGRRGPSAVLLGVYNLVVTIAFMEPVVRSFPSLIATIGEIFIATSALMLGPCLYLYVRHRINGSQKWDKSNALHFIPAIIMMTLTIAGQFIPDSPGNETVDVLAYAFFVMSLMMYSVEALLMILRKRNKDRVKYPQKIQFVFLLLLVITSLSLFGFSTLYTSMGFVLTQSFIITIQVMLFLIIAGIALLNPELAEKHKWS